MKPAHVTQVLALEKYLDKHDELLRQSRAEYLTYQGDGIETLDFQTKLVEQALSAKQMWTAELATGIGKTVIAARIALDRLHDGPILYICPNGTAIGDLQGGIVNKFARTFTAYGKSDVDFGTMNEMSLAHDVNFLTPRALVGSLQRDPKRVTELLKRASCLIVDEAHHFPEDVDCDLRVFGLIYDAAERHVRDGLTVAMSGTWGRLDHKPVMGQRVPDARLTVQDAVDLKRCPELYGVQVITDVRAKKASKRADLYDFHLEGKERLAYFDGIVECMQTTYRRYPKPFAAFARSRTDAAAIAARFNEASKLGNRGLAVLTGLTPYAARQAIVRDIIEGRRAGYVTCAVGEEAIDLPPLEVVHLIRRTCSYTRNMQAIGRALRVHNGKRRALVVDYQTIIEGITDRLVGLTCDDLAEHSGARDGGARLNGGPLVAQASYPQAVLVGMTMQDERALVCVDHSEVVKKKRELLDIAVGGQARPTETTDPRLYNALRNYTCAAAKTFDYSFTQRLYTLRPDWLKDPTRVAAKKAELRRRAIAGEARPHPKAERELARTLHNCTTSKSRMYDATLSAELKTRRPDWFRNGTDIEIAQRKRTLLDHARRGNPRPQKPDPLAGCLSNYLHFDAAFREKVYQLRPDWFKRGNIEPSKVQIKRLALHGAPRPAAATTLGAALVRFCTRANSRQHDAALYAELRALRPDWFVSTSAAHKQELLQLARDGAARPTVRTNKKLHDLFWRYATPKTKLYDKAFTKTVFGVRPDWQWTRLKKAA